jgi:phage gp36-like protein
VQNITDATILEFVEKASGRIDSYLRGRYTLPLQQPYPDEIVQASLHIARLRLLTWRGFNPDEFDAGYREDHNEAILWLRDIAAGRAHLDVHADQTTANEGRPRVITSDQQGWHDEQVEGA